ncbi:MAG TPA: TlpA disulfide reductase family protein [Pirellulales bacterium]|nr:TlpA disulfide reductase family protein [Pirellulales bacterium]
MVKFGLTLLRQFAVAGLAATLPLYVAPARLPAQQPIVPRYRLRLGQELIYRVTATKDFRDPDNASPREQHEWHVTVARENHDGSWRLFIRTGQLFLNSDGSERLKRDSFDYCDIQPDGSYSLDERTATFKMLLPYELFCRLPATPAKLRGRWSYEPPVLGTGFTYHVVKSDGPRLQIAATQKDEYSEGRYEFVRSYEFDQDRALVTSIVLESKDLASGQPHSRRTISLISDTQRDAVWTARFYQESQRYLDANGKWMALCYQGIRARNEEDCREARAEARAVLVAGREQAQMDYFRNLFETNLQTHDKEEAGHLAVVRDRERFFAVAPNLSASWEAKAFDGSTFRLADHRGEVVVLYFWSTGCAYCMLAAPQISSLAAEYKDRKVSVVGMFVRNGSEEGIPRHATTVGYRGFPHVEAKEIYDLYQLQKYGLYIPTTLVLDREGKICEGQGGYSADLGEWVRSVVDNRLGGTEARDD